MAVDKRSENNLKGVHPDLVKVVREAAELADFVVVEGLRTVARQKELVAAGASKTMRSRHLTGHAVDLAATVGGQIRWDWPLYTNLAKAMLIVAKTGGVAIEWGGSWPKFPDGPHFQLDWKEYP